MANFENISRLAPLPIINLRDITLPNDGFQVPLSESCKRSFRGGEDCRNHYERLSIQGVIRPEELVQCPFGFASLPFKIGNEFVAMTGVVPFPRLGGAKETIVAKRHKENRIATASLSGIIEGLRTMFAELRALEDETVNNYSVAFHEIRKLNAKILQTAERLCRDETPHDPEAATRELVTIWKTAELMSKQFEVSEILANQRIAEYPLNTVIQPYRIFDKCVRVFRVLSQNERFTIRATQGFVAEIRAYDKTFPIIPTVLIGNAEKYSTLGSEIRVYLEGNNQTCTVRVSSISEGKELLTDAIFDRGVRGNSTKQGSGNGLFVAQLIARQHGTRILVNSLQIHPNVVRHEFSITFEKIKDRNRT